MQTHWSIIVILLAWIAVTQGIWFIVESRRQKWWAFSFLINETTRSVESKIFSFDEALNPKFITDEDGYITSANKEAVRIFGYKKNDAVGKHIEMLIPEKDRVHYREMLLKVSMDAEEEKGKFIDAVNKKGASVSVEMVVRKKPFGRNAFFLVIFRDRTREVATTRKYEQLIELLKHKIEVLDKGEEIGNAGSWLWELGDKNEMFVSPGYRKILGMEMKETYDAKEIRKKVWDEDEEIVNEALKKAFSGKPYSIQYRMKRASDFKLIFLNSSARPIIDEDGIVTHIYGYTRLIQTQNIRGLETEINPIP